MTARAGRRTGSNHLLAGLLYDDRGSPMTPTHTRKADGRRYRYYVSQPVLQNRPEDAGAVARVSAQAIEDLVTAQVRRAAQDPVGRKRTAAGPDAAAPPIRAVVRRVEIQETCVQITMVDETRAVPIRLKGKGSVVSVDSAAAGGLAPNTALSRPWPGRGPGARR